MKKIETWENVHNRSLRYISSNKNQLIFILPNGERRALRHALIDTFSPSMSKIDEVV